MKTFHSPLSPLSRLARLCAAIALAGASVACSGVNATSPDTPAPKPDTVSAPAPAPVSTGAPAGDLRAQLKAEIGDARCDNSSQCKSVPVGSKACGGPEAYLPYSTKTGDSAKIVRLAAEDAAARKAQDQRAGIISNCMMLMDPGAVCNAGRCVAGKAGLPTH